VFPDMNLNGRVLYYPLIITKRCLFTCVLSPATHALRQNMAVEKNII
jgi:hypothetical protein